MLRRGERALTKEEREAIHAVIAAHPVAQLSETIRWSVLWTVGLAGAGGGFFWFLSKTEGLGLWGVAACTSTSCLVGVGSFYGLALTWSSHLHWAKQDRAFQQDREPRLRAALDDGRARVLEVLSDDAIEIEEVEDEGSAYLFGLGDGTSLFLHGQEYAPQRGDDPWPAHRFQIVRTFLGAEWVGVFGASRAPARTRRVSMSAMPAGFASGGAPPTETVLPGEPDAALERLGHDGSTRKRRSF